MSLAKMDSLNARDKVVRFSLFLARALAFEGGDSQIRRALHTIKQLIPQQQLASLEVLLSVLQQTHLQSVQRLYSKTKALLSLLPILASPQGLKRIESVLADSRKIFRTGKWVVEIKNALTVSRPDGALPFCTHGGDAHVLTISSVGGADILAPCVKHCIHVS